MPSPSAPRLLGLFLVSSLTLATPAAPAAEGVLPPADRPRLVIVSWDGAADWVVDRLLAEGRLPQLAALAADGVAADHSVTSFPSKTATGHATLWTGAWPSVHGITGNRVPRAAADSPSLLESRSGFSAEALTAEPLWVTAAKAGRTAVVLSATQGYPPEPHLAALERAGVAAGRLRTFSGFEHRIARGEVLTAGELQPTAGWPEMPEHVGEVQELAFYVGDDPFFALLYDAPGDPTGGFDRVLVRQGRRDGEATAEAVLVAAAAGEAPTAWSPPFPVRRGERRGNTFFRLFALAPDGSELVLYQRGASGLGGAHSAAEAAAYLAAYPGFHDDPFDLYEGGRFGLPRMAGGDGEAERRALELVAFDTSLLAEGSCWALSHWQPDLLFHYSPMADSAGHTWMGLLDPASPLYDEALAAELWPHYARVFALLDGWLGRLRACAPPETVVAVVSDHGMEGAVKNFYPNRVLEEAGLAVRAPSGDFDLTRSRALAPAFGDFFVSVNSRRWKGGIVADEEREAVLTAAAEALLVARDPEDGRRIVTAVFRPEGLPGLGIGGPAGGDLYFELAPGYYPVSRPSEVTVRSQGPWGGGEHGFWPQRRSMHAIFYAAGPGLRRGVSVPAIRHVDVAPTLARLLGIPAPPQAQGHVIGEALAR